MRIEQLIYLVEIADAGSISAAADRLHIAQPSISQSVCALENELGVTLLLRTRSGTKPTPTGTVVIEKARHILDEIQQLKGLPKSIEQGNKTITVIAGVVPISTFLPEAIKASKIEEYGYTVNVREGSSKDAEYLLNEGKADFAVIAYVDVPSLPGFSFTHLLTSNMVAMVNSESELAGKKTLSYQEIQPYPIAIGTEEYPSSQAALEKLSFYGKVNISLRTQNVALMQKRVESGNLVALVHAISFSHNSYFDRSYKTTLIPIQNPVRLKFGILSKEKWIQSAMANRLISELKKSAWGYQG